MSETSPARPTGSVAQRIMVYGVTGSGKSVAAAAIAAHLDLPLVAIDELTWRTGWEAVPVEQQRQRIADVVAGDAWVIDHGYGAWLDVVLERVELVVALDYPRLVSLSRLIRRSLANVVTRRRICNGNVETWRRLLGADSIVRWHHQSFPRRRLRMRGWQASQNPTTLLLSRPRQLRRWMAEPSAGPGAPAG